MSTQNRQVLADHRDQLLGQPLVNWLTSIEELRAKESIADVEKFEDFLDQLMATCGSIKLPAKRKVDFETDLYEQLKLVKVTARSSGAEPNKRQRTIAQYALGSLYS